MNPQPNLETKLGNQQTVVMELPSTWNEFISSLPNYKQGDILAIKLNSHHHRIIHDERTYVHCLRALSQSIGTVDPNWQKRLFEVILELQTTKDFVEA